MFCRNCGKELSYSAKFCHECGTAVEATSFYPVVNSMANNQLAASVASGALTFGILGIAFSMTVWFSFLGIIFSGIALGKVKKYRCTIGEGNGKVITGRILGIIGLIFGILYTLLGIFYVMYIVWIFSATLGVSAI